MPAIQNHTIDAEVLQKAIFDSASFSCIATDVHGVIQIFNVGAEHMLGYSALDVTNRLTPAEFSDSQELVERAKRLSLEQGTSIAPGFEALVFKASRGIQDSYDLTYVRRDGSRFPAVVSVTALRDAQQAIIGYLLIGADNTLRKQSEAEQARLHQQLRDYQFYARALFDFNVDALMTVNRSGVITDVNRQMEALTQCGRGELIRTPFRNHFTAPERADAAIELVLIQSRISNFELVARAKDGKFAEVECFAATFFDANGVLQGVFAALRDVTEIKESRRVLEQALHDPLTGLPNRQLFAERMDQMIATSKRSGRYGALLYMDLDNFKNLNDVHGHAMGDMLLQEAARRIRSCLREVDIVARFGGDEFVVVLGELGVDTAEAARLTRVVTEKICITLAKPYQLTGENGHGAQTSVLHHCTASIGVTLFINHEANQDALLKQADTAMYQAKTAGGNRVQFYEPKDGQGG